MILKNVCGIRASHRTRFRAVLLATALLISAAAAAGSRTDYKLTQPFYTIESAHFRINYEEGLLPSAKRSAVILERLYGIYRNIYDLTLPTKTEVLIVNNDVGDGFADAVHNLILVTVNGLDFINLRGSHDYLGDVLTHEYGHIVSITSGLKTPSWLLGFQGGFFTHPNEAKRVEALHFLPSDILPMWIVEGIAQYESSQFGKDSWDSHRDMILRTATLSKKLAVYDMMCTYTGEKWDDYEKSYYNQGFSLVRYISTKYGYDKVAAMLRESAHPLRLNFDRNIKAVLGISTRELYSDWKHDLEKRYKAQIDSLGKQVYGKRLSKDGFNNYWPRFSPDGKKLYFVSNAKEDYRYFVGLYSYTCADTVKEDKRIKSETNLRDFYDIASTGKRFVSASMGDPKSVLPNYLGGGRTRDLVILDTLPLKHPRLTKLFKKARSITAQKSLFQAAFSPKCDKLACSRHENEFYSLCLIDSSGKNLRRVYPGPNDAPIQTIYSIDWSPDGHHIAISYIDTSDRKIGIYDTLTKKFEVFCDTKHDERDPRYSRDGKWLYFSSDRTGIFNVYRYELDSAKLQRVTNVSGGAFSPEISADNKRLAYAGYDKDGFEIYLIDTLRSLEEKTVDTAMVERTGKPAAPVYDVVVSAPRDYTHLPRQGMLLPTAFAEQDVADVDNVFKGNTVFKAGAVAYLEDPFSAFGKGNSLGGYFLVEPSKLFSFFDAKNVINPDVNYDLGLFGSSEVLPISLRFDYLHRAIAGEDQFITDAGQNLLLKYSLIPRSVDGVAFKDLKTVSNIPLTLYGIASYNWTDIELYVPDLSYSQGYSGAQGYRFGTYLTSMDRDRSPRMSIMPTGYYAKLQYDFYDQRLQNEDRPFDSTGFHVLYDDYRFNQISGSAGLGVAMPWHDQQSLLVNLRATALELTSANKKELIRNGMPGELPSYYQPVEWLPGYTYFFRDTLHRANGTDSLVRDTVLITGDAVAMIQASYRFPLWVRSINRKLGAIYLHYLYGCVNFGAAAGWQKPSDMLSMHTSDWLTSAGLELRLEAITFNSLPLALSMRWDRGMDRPSPLGGDRYTLTIGFDFDNWDLVEEPDYAKAPAGRFGARILQ